MNTLPESLEDAQDLATMDRLNYRRCVECGRDLAAQGAARTPAGWRETQISGMCEGCYDALFEDED